RRGLLYDSRCAQCWSRCHRPGMGFDARCRWRWRRCGWKFGQRRRWRPLWRRRRRVWQQQRHCRFRRARRHRHHLYAGRRRNGLTQLQLHNRLNTGRTRRSPGEHTSSSRSSRGAFLLWSENMNPAAFSKINWTQAVAFLAMLLTLFGIDMPDNVKLETVALIQAVQTIATWLLHNVFKEVK